MPQESVYCFNAQVAKKFANNDIKGNMFFYNGVSIENTPTNCINVPIESFYDFFLSAPYPLVSQINFDNTEFSDDIKRQINQNITDTIIAVRNEKVQIINTFLQTTVDENNYQASLYFLLRELTENPYKDSSINIIEKILSDHYIFLQLNSFTINNNLLLIIDKLKKIILEKPNMVLLHLLYFTEFLKYPKDVQNMKLNYLKSIVEYNNFADFFTFHRFVKLIYPPEVFKEYITDLAPIIFSEDFFALTTLEQKERIYKFFYCNNISYSFGEDFKLMYNYMYPIFTKAIEKNLDEIVMYIYYPLQYSWNGVSQTQEERKAFNNTVELKLETYIKNTLMQKHHLKANTKIFNPKKKKIKVAFLQERIINYSIEKVFYSLIQVLASNLNQEYEFIIYDLNFMELLGSDKNEVAKLQALGIKYVDLHHAFYDSNYVFYPLMEKMLKIRKQIIHDDVDILIGMHSRAEYNFLFTTRTAPKQIYWSHGNFEYNLDAIDSKISHTHADDKAYKNFDLPKNKKMYNPEVSAAAIQEIRNRYPSNSVILGSIGRLIKIDSPIYIKTVAQIMMKHKNTIYLACGSGNKTNIKQLTLQYGISDRFYFTGHINSHIYGHVLDIFLDSFPHRQGESLQEFFMKGKPFVSYLSPEEYALPSLFDHYSPNIEHYINLASKFIESANYRNKFGAALAQKAEASVDNTSILNSFIKAIG